MGEDARAALETAHEISKLLDCGLDKETLSICVALIENGVNPEVCQCQQRCSLIASACSLGSLSHLPHAPQALADVVKRLRKQAADSARAGASRSGTTAA